MQEGMVGRIKKEKLTRGQWIIADYFIKNQNRICNMTSLEIARAIGVSDASVIRFARAIGYEGFADLKYNLYEELAARKANAKLGDHSVSERFNIQSERYRAADTAEEMLRILLKNVEHSLKQNSAEEYERVVEAIRAADHKYVIGLRGARGCAVHFGRLLSYLTENVVVISDSDNDSIITLQGITDRDAVIMINFARYYKIDMVMAEMIKKKGAALCVLSDSMTSPIARDAEVILLVDTEHMSFFNSALGAMGILEYLLTLLGFKEPERLEEKLNDRDEMLKDFRLEGC